VTKLSDTLTDIERLHIQRSVTYLHANRAIIKDALAARGLSLWSLDEVLNVLRMLRDREI
jgi:hypothetical protein